ncbi:glycosyltransferase [Paenibacillus cymbidii]|uniref:glycosyltransferase n=1 Tax=Paenibacillus cymbidii TaxID=1639034 RepID=UPI001436BDCB|nr:glycosyltransferase [Paenibacillus cymbidii]
MEVKSKIRHMLQAGRTDIAKLLLREYGKQQPNDGEVRLWKAQIAIAEGKLDEAQTTLIEALGHRHQDAAAARLLADVYRRKRQPAVAASVYRLAEAIASRDTTGTNPDEAAAIAQELRETITEAAAMQTDPAEQYPDYAYPDAPEPLISIVVLGYNHAAHTKMCIESIYRHTVGIPFELITVDNGSADDTDTFLRTLPNRKKITLLPNQGPVGGFNAGMLAADAEYTACISNDFLMTANWLDNLLRCIESDPTVGFVSPGANTVSNFQRIPGEYASLEEMHRFAQSYNVSDPAKWEERLQLMPCVLMARTAALRDAGYFDPRFRYGEFADDDISFRIRRAGYKLLFARDTFTYHFGSVTVREDQVKHRSLEESRTIFQAKYGIDAWSESRFDPLLVQCAMEMMPPPALPGFGRLRILGVNTGCGATPLQLRNALRSAGYGQAEIVSYTDRRKFAVDLETISSRTECGPLDEIAARLPHDAFDIVLFGGGWARCESPAALMRAIRPLMKRSGLFLCKLRNMGHYLALIQQLADRTLVPDPGLTGLDAPPRLPELLEALHQGRLPVAKLFHISGEIEPTFSSLYKSLQTWAASGGLNAGMLAITDTVVAAAAD